MLRWGVVNNVTQELQGEPGEGTTVDFEEPFVIKLVVHDELMKINSKPLLRIGCDEDGWNLQVNEEPVYQTFMHLFSPSKIKNLAIKGKLDVSYVGIGSKGIIFTTH